MNTCSGSKYGDVAAEYVKQFVDNYDINYAVAKVKYPNLKIYSGTTAYLDPNQGCVSLGFLQGQIDLINRAKDDVNSQTKYSASEKQAYLKRLTMCETSPIYTIYRFYDSFYPLAASDVKFDFVVKMFELMDYAGQTHYTEMDTLAQLKKNWGII